MIVHAKNIRGMGALVLSKNLIFHLQKEISVVLASFELSKMIIRTNTQYQLILFQFSYLRGYTNYYLGNSILEKKALSFRGYTSTNGFETSCVFS